MPTSSRSAVPSCRAVGYARALRVTDHDLNDRRGLVTGGSGFVGRHVVAELAAAGATVRVVDLNPHPDPTVDVVIGDIADPDVLAPRVGGGFVFVLPPAAG